jgi:hypothetical protein
VLITSRFLDWHSGVGPKVVKGSLQEISAAASILEIQPDKLNRQIRQEADPNDFEHKHDANHYSGPYTLESVFAGSRCGAARGGESDVEVRGRGSGVGIRWLTSRSRTSRRFVPRSGPQL